jgi:fumarate hydratase class II
MIIAYAVLKKAAAIVNHQAGRLGDEQKNLICQTCDEILAGQQKKGPRLSQVTKTEVTK